MKYKTGSSLILKILFRQGNCIKQTWTYGIYPDRDDLELKGNCIYLHSKYTKIHMQIELITRSTAVDQFFVSMSHFFFVVVLFQDIEDEKFLD